MKPKKHKLEVKEIPNQNEWPFTLAARLDNGYSTNRLAKADSTLKSSQTFPHPSINRALCC